MHASHSVRGVNGASFRCGSGSWWSAIQSEKSRRSVVRTTMSSSISKFSTRVFRTRGGIDAFDLQQRGRRVAQLAQRPIDRLEQVVGAVVRHLHVGVADHPEQVRVDDLDAGEQLRRGSRG